MESTPLNDNLLLKAGFELVEQPEDEEIEAPYYVKDNILVGLLPDGVMVSFMKDVIDDEGELASEVRQEFVFDSCPVHKLQSLVYGVTGQTLQFG